MKKLFYLIVITFIFFSCNNKKYNYVVTLNEIDSVGNIKEVVKDPEIINAGSDIDAYEKAYQKYAIHKTAIQQKFDETGVKKIDTIFFNLTNEEGVEVITLIEQSKKTTLEERINKDATKARSKVEKENSKELVSKEPEIIIDSATVKKLKPLFIISKEEFSNDNIEWYTPKSAPKYTNRNALYCYFNTNNEKPGNLRLRMQYYSDDWLFIRNIIFSVDGVAINYQPQKMERDNGDGYIWEWFDDSANTALVTAISNAKEVKMKLNGNQYHDIRNVSKDQIKSIKQTLDLYKAMGGKL